MTEYTDEQVMQRVKEDNLSELSVLFGRYQVELYNFFLKMTRDRSLSHDLTQNLFYRILKYRRTYLEGEAFRPWVYRMARNLCSDHFSRKKWTTEFSDWPAVRPDYSDQDQTGYGEEEYRLLEDALAELPEKQRELLVLSRFQGLSYAEISTINRLSVPAIKVQVHRAIKQLRTIYFEKEKKQ